MISDVIFVLVSLAGLALLVAGAYVIYAPSALVLGGLLCLKVAAEYAKNGVTE